MSVPRLLHQLWLGPKSLPEREKFWCAEMARMNPTWMHHVHGNELLTIYQSDPYVISLLSKCRDDKKFYAFLCDRLRLLLLRDHGGVYLDVDCQPVAPLDTLKCWDWPHVGFVYGTRSPHRADVALHRGVPLVDNTFMASSKNGRMVNRLLALWSPKRTVITGHDCGIAILENQGEDTVALNQRYFYAEQRYPETIALHDAHNLASWLGPGNQRPRLIHA